MTETTDTVTLPAAPVVAPEDRLANTATGATSQANRITALVGLSGGGKSSLADTAAEYCHETYHKTTLCYANDPGGFGTKRLALIRAGILHVWDPRNHVKYFETMELATLGAWPEVILDPERGYADPYVRLILPRRIVFDLLCPQGHVARRFENQAVMNTISAQGGVPCATCQVQTNLVNALRVEQLVVRHSLFRHVGMRIYDSITAMNDQGLIIELPGMSARGEFAVSRSGGSALGSADAFTQGTATYGTGSEAQVGFMQNRTYGWLMNIRQIPDAVMPTIVTFGLEESKKDDESGGMQILGPRIAGKARTSAVPGWVGDLLYASLEPEGVARGTADGHMVYRLWLTTHVDPRDSRRLPILAKHRGTPLGIDYLEDPWYETPEERRVHAWERCSLKVFFSLLDTQVNAELAALQVKYPDAPGFQPPSEEPVGDEVVGSLDMRPAGVAGPMGVTSGGPMPLAAAAPAAPGAPRVVGRRGRVSSPSVPQPAPLAVPVSPPSVGTSAQFGAVSPATPMVAMVSEPPSVVETQLRASVAAIAAQQAGPADTGTPTLHPVTSLTPVSVPVPSPPAAAVGTPRLARRPRPPVS